MTEIAGSLNMHVRMGCVNADWFDNNSQRVVGTRTVVRRDGLEIMPVFLLEFDAPGGANSRLVWSGDKFDPEDWLEILLEPGNNALIFRNLYADGLPTNIASIVQVPEATRAALEEAHDLDEWVLGDDEIQGLLGGSTKRSIEGIGVYDVGQGSCIGLSPRSNSPILYFDFGGGAAVHKSTRPHKTPELCLCSDPMIVLSHWDADHWSSAPLVPASLSLTWIAPYQSLTPPQLVFAGTITGTLAVSKAPSGTKFTFANVEVHRSTGPWSDRNNSGFFLVVDDPSSGDPFFFPGDADYANTASMPASAAGMASTHHGGNWSSTTAPPNASGSGADRVVFSFGMFSATKPNTYGHPTTTSRNDHAAVGFSGLDTPLRTGGSSGNGTGHVYLDWSAAPALPGTWPCGKKSCYQNFDQC
jgi:hypothetical protein